jgi:hypothetical protein
MNTATDKSSKYTESKISMTISRRSKADAMRRSDKSKTKQNEGAPVNCDICMKCVECMILENHANHANTNGQTAQPVRTEGGALAYVS